MLIAQIVAGIGVLFIFAGFIWLGNILTECEKRTSTKYFGLTRIQKVSEDSKAAVGCIFFGGMWIFIAICIFSAIRLYTEIFLPISAALLK